MKSFGEVLRIALLGYGKMGRLLDRMATEAGHEVILKIGSDNAHDLTVAHLQGADVAIDFSHPSTGFEHVEICLRAGVPVVSGTTGWLDRFGEAKQLCGELNGALFYASNFSVGVNVFFALNRFLAQQMNSLPDYRVTLSETHHTAKVDAPSGTALTIAEGILAELDRLETLPTIESHRIDPTPGTHEVVYRSAEDRIRIEHVAHGREGFARGALRAAAWIVGRKGVFGMSDLLRSA